MIFSVIRFQIMYSVAFALSCSFITNAADKVSALVGWSKPPYVIQMDDSGFEIELIESVFRRSDADVTFSYAPYGRTPWLIKQKKFDVALTMSPKHDLTGAYVSDSYISYQNVVVKLKSLNVKVEHISDIKDYSVAGFQNATKVLGTEYKNMGSSNALYFEVPDQRHQVELLILGRVDFVVLDVNIFNYLSKSITGSNFMKKVDILYLFPESKYHLACAEENICAKFNHHLKAFKKTKEYKELLLKYDFISAPNRP